MQPHSQQPTDTARSCAQRLLRHCMSRSAPCIPGTHTIKQSTANKQHKLSCGMETHTTCTQALNRQTLTVTYRIECFDRLQVLLTAHIYLLPFTYKGYTGQQVG